MKLFASLYSFLSKNSFLLPLGVFSLTLILLLLTLLPSNFIGNNKLWSYDKLGHAILFFSWCLFLGLYYQISRSTPVKPWVIFVSGVTFGFIIEILQHILPLNRHADPMDFLFDVIGCLIAAWILKIIQQKKTPQSAQAPPS